MSEYWVSHKRYLCKYCNIYIADDKPSRQQHENGLRHQGNVERFVRGLYKDGEKRVKEREEEKGIMASVGKAAEAAYALDVAAGRAGRSSGGSTSRDTTAVPKPPKPKMGQSSDPYANYSTPASLGYTDPDGEVAQQRMHAGTPGAWTVVEKSTERESEEGEEKSGEKRKAEEEEKEEEERSFKVRRKTVALGLGQVYDPANVRPDSEVEVEPSLFRKRKSRPRMQ